MVGPLLSPGITRRTFGRATPCARKYVSMASTFEFLVTTYARPCERNSETKSLSTARRRAAAASASGVRSLKFFGSGDAPAFVAHIVRSKSRKTQNAFVVSTSCATSSASPRETPHASHAARSHRRHARACGQKNPGGHAGDIGHRPASLAACSHNTHVDPTIHNFEYDRSHLPHRFVPSARVTRAAAAPSTRPPDPDFARARAARVASATGGRCPRLKKRAVGADEPFCCSSRATSASQRPRLPPRGSACGPRSRSGFAAS